MAVLIITSPHLHWVKTALSIRRKKNSACTHGTMNKFTLHYPIRVLPLLSVRVPPLLTVFGHSGVSGTLTSSETSVGVGSPFNACQCHPDVNRFACVQEISSIRVPPLSHPGATPTSSLREWACHCYAPTLFGCRPQASLRCLWVTTGAIKIIKNCFNPQSYQLPFPRPFLSLLPEPYPQQYPEASE